MSKMRLGKLRVLVTQQCHSERSHQAEEAGNPCYCQTPTETHWGLSTSLLKMDSGKEKEEPEGLKIKQ